MISQRSFDGLAFPVVRVRFAGPTDYRGARYLASVRGVRVSHSFDYAGGPGENALAAAQACWAKYRGTLPGEYFAEADEPRVFIPGDLDSDAYAFTVIPAGFFAAGGEGRGDV